MNQDIKVLGFLVDLMLTLNEKGGGGARQDKGPQGVFRGFQTLRLDNLGEFKISTRRPSA